jgi:hypothetical protein
MCFYAPNKQIKMNPLAMNAEKRQKSEKLYSSVITKFCAESSRDQGELKHLVKILKATLFNLYHEDLQLYGECVITTRQKTNERKINHFIECSFFFPIKD